MIFSHSFPNDLIPMLIVALITVAIVVFLAILADRMNERAHNKLIVAHIKQQASSLEQTAAYQKLVLDLDEPDKETPISYLMNSLILKLPLMEVGKPYPAVFGGVDIVVIKQVDGSVEFFARPPENET
jgi:hypothetical protein